MNFYDNSVKKDVGNNVEKDVGNDDMKKKEDDSKIEGLLHMYDKLNTNQRGQFIGALIGQYNLLKDLGVWFDPNPFTALFKTEFEKGSREKALVKLADIDYTSDDKPKKIFWIPSINDEHNVLFQNLVKSKDYKIEETTCVLDYDDEYVIIYNNVEIDSQYPLAYGHVKYEDAKQLGNVEIGVNGGYKITIKGYLAHIV